MDQVNAGLKHSNPQVRKEGEKLFKTLYCCGYGAKLEPMLIDQKTQLTSKLLSSAKQEVLSAGLGPSSSGVSANPGKNAQSEQQSSETGVKRATNQIRDSVLD